MWFFKINGSPGRKKYLLSVLPFLVLVVSYILLATFSRQENAQYKITPTLPEMGVAFHKAITESDNGRYFIEIGPEEGFCSQEELKDPAAPEKWCFGGDLFVDTWASGRRFLISLAVLFFGILWGLHMGLLPYFEALFYRFGVFFDKLPALLLLPILFMIVGVDELAKVFLVVIGVMPTIVLDTYLRTKEIHREQIVKGFTLGATDMEIAYRIVLPQIFPRVLNTIRLNFKTMVSLLIAAEAISATEGLGYRSLVFLRHIAMDSIIPYVLWAGSLFFIADWLVTRWIQRYDWLDKE